MHSPLQELRRNGDSIEIVGNLLNETVIRYCRLLARLVFGALGAAMVEVAAGFVSRFNVFYLFITANHTVAVGAFDEAVER
ncbi:MAG: hypothetical protein COT71_00570 [Candidatus Andersenbacteria bacterium CG10_big_fil_rev_8_21_14_0_10_54_11]|uniref:Uncharacterized protein n=1 Tax=Candidatus Andersenbacteria bacterium CG10_big_fil_rev_8_21_14_0_10_54_11 TaxID=1974485 RepID=A0A2M6X063_9BACT|nr:MAG: hypothetical protein COT71_00570 [Candidatus Andersenbacteria bacterium CG10_big_fil_rev_8_21_14_0_10_54_11]